MPHLLVSSVPCSLHFADLAEVCCRETSKYQEDCSCSGFQGASGSLHFAFSVLCEMLCCHASSRTQGWLCLTICHQLHEGSVWSGSSRNCMNQSSHLCNVPNKHQKHQKPPSAEKADREVVAAPWWQKNSVEETLRHQLWHEASVSMWHVTCDCRD